MFTIPNHLTDIHNRRSKQLDKSFYQSEAHCFYTLEELFIIPLYVKSDMVVDIAKSIFQHKDKRSFKKAFKKYGVLLINQYDLNNKNILNRDVEIKYSTKKSKVSFYSISKRNIFINEYSIDIGMKTLEGTAKLLYTLIHELSHSIVSLHLNDFESHHNHYFLDVLLNVLKDVSNINPSKVFSKKVATYRVARATALGAHSESHYFTSVRMPVWAGARLWIEGELR